MYEQGERLDWTGPAPRSVRFDDIYFSPDDGLAESRAVFLEGCGLPDAWVDRERFVVGELGFGTGLNVLALLQLWRRTCPAGARLHVFSVEAHPLAREDADRAFAAWPELAQEARALLEHWPDRRAGMHRIDFAAFGAILDLYVGEAGEAVEAWTGRADAWFLDGFAPSKNPDMWRPDLLAAVAARSAPGARVASFTVAGAVRRALIEAGFHVDRRPGFGSKRQRLEGRLERPAPAIRSPARPAQRAEVLILGAGIAGASLARAFRRLGVEPRVIEAERPGAGGSGNPAALVTPRLDAGLDVVARLHAHAFARAVELYRAETPQALVGEGALQLETAPRDARRFDTLAGWPGFAPGALARLEPGAAADRLDEPSAPGALWFRDALTIAPAAVLEAWLERALVIRAAAARLEASSSGWRILDEAGAPVAVAEVVCLALGPFSARLGALALRPVRGQLAWSATPFSGEAAAWGGYAVPTPEGGTLFGATHGRDDWSVELRPDDDVRNLEALAQGRPALAARVRERLGAAPLQARAALRAATPDHLPLAGALADASGLFVLSGLGGRGFTLAPLLAEHVAALALGAPSPLTAEAAAALDPARFQHRATGLKPTALR